MDADRPPYVPRGAAWTALHSHAPELLLSGPAGTGKSVACLMKLHLCAEHVPGFRALICRRTRASLTDTGLVTFERDVLPPHHPALGKVKRQGRHSYVYPNGAEIVVGGLDESARIMSADYDVVYVQEATEVTEAAWENVTTRLRNGRLPYQQLIADCNPDRPTHWLKKRWDAGKVLGLESRHEDNPRLWDASRGRWTPFGLRYVAILDALSGPRKLRLRHGRWVRAEGVVYETYDPAIHLIDRFAIPDDWPRIWVVDFGYRNPFVWLDCALDGDGRLYVVRQIYRTGRIVEDHAARVLALMKDSPAPVAVLCDHDAEDRATLERHLGVRTLAAPKAKKPGIEAVQARLRVQGDGRPRLYVLRDGVDERDEALSESKRPCSTEEEFDGYVWDNKLTKEEPVKEDDHGLDCIRYVTLALDGAPSSGDNERQRVLRA